MASADVRHAVTEGLEEWARDLVGGWESWIELPRRVGDRLARTCLGARPGEVLVSDEVKERWDGDGVRFHPVGPVALKGVKDELMLYAASRA